MSSPKQPAGATDRVAVILNGLGRTKYEELFVVWKTVATRLAAAGLTVVQPEVGELVTSLDMAGCSLTVTWLDDELERLWTSPADTPAYRKGQIVSATDILRERSHTPARTSATASTFVDADEPARACGAHVADAIVAIAGQMSAAEDELGRIDAVAGDGDHGRGMVRGTEAASTAATLDRAPRWRDGLSSGGCGRGLGRQSGRHIRSAVGRSVVPLRAAGLETVARQPTSTWPTHCAPAMTR